MEVVVSFIIAVMAGVVGHYINKRLNSKGSEDSK